MVSEFLNRKMNPRLAVGLLSLLVIIGGIFSFVNHRASAIPYGGIVTKYTPMCVLDSPAISPTTCAISCPICTGMTGSGCVGFEEILIAPLTIGGAFVCPPKGFRYVVGVPHPGGFIFGQGAPIAPSDLGAL